MNYNRSTIYLEKRETKIYILPNNVYFFIFKNVSMLIILSFLKMYAMLVFKTRLFEVHRNIFYSKYISKYVLKFSSSQKKKSINNNLTQLITALE